LNGITGLEFSRLGQSVMRQIEKMSKPTVAAIQGYCLGGALDLALACRARIATPDARFAHPGAARGIITGWGGTQRLSRLVGAARATDLFLTGRMVSAKEALSFGLIRGIYSAGDLLPGAIQLVR
jgi:enoyl-CoA hydratase